jgi:hypothetical protein
MQRTSRAQPAESGAAFRRPARVAFDQADITREPRAAVPGPDPPQRAHGRSAFPSDYSLHADRHIHFDDREGLERLCRHGARATLAHRRLSLDERRRAVVELERRHFDGRTHIAFEPAELLRTLATLIPPPWKNLTRYHGVFAPAHHARADIVPAPRSGQGTAGPRRCARQRCRRAPAAGLEPHPSGRAPAPRVLRRRVALRALRRPQRILAVITEPQTIHRILDLLGVETGATPATGPPAQAALH